MDPWLASQGSILGSCWTLEVSDHGLEEFGPNDQKKTGIFGHFLGRKMSQKMTIFDHFWPIRPKLVPQTPHRYRFQSYDGKNGPPGRPEGRFRGVHFRSFWTLWGVILDPLGGLRSGSGRYLEGSGPNDQKKTGIFGHFLGRKMSQKMTIFDHFWPIRPKLVPQTPHRYRFQSYDGKNGPPGRPEGRFRGVHFRSFWTLWGSQIRVWKGVWPPQTPHRYRFQSYNGKKWTPGQPGVHFGVIWTLWGLIPQVVRHS